MASAITDLTGVLFSTRSSLASVLSTRSSLVGLKLPYEHMRLIDVQGVRTITASTKAPKINRCQAGPAMIDTPIQSSDLVTSCNELTSVYLLSGSD
jgi:hypothetical protein